MKILFLGDVFGEPGRTALKNHLPKLKEELQPDVTIINGENSAHGRGISADTAKDIFAAGADVITLGDHTFDQKDSDTLLANSPKIIRPANFGSGTPGRGSVVFTARNGQKILVTNVLGRVFMKTASQTDCPFRTLDGLLAVHKMGVEGGVDAVFVDMHTEATSEKACFAHYLDGRVSGVVGTHTHIPTSDTRILPKGTAFQTDAGMCGDYSSSLGLDLQAPTQAYLSAGRHPFTPAKGPATLNGTFIETDAKGLAIKVMAVRAGQSFPLTA